MIKNIRTTALTQKYFIPTLPLSKNAQNYQNAKNLKQITRKTNLKQENNQIKYLKF